MDEREVMLERSDVPAPGPPVLWRERDDVDVLEDTLVGRRMADMVRVRVDGVVVLMVEIVIVVKRGNEYRQSGQAR